MRTSSFTYEKNLKNFGEEVANLVDGVTKLAKIPVYKQTGNPGRKPEKMFLAMSKDIRVIIIKLADRLHNMRNPESTSQEKQIEIARETLIYTLAHRLEFTR